MTVSRLNLRGFALTLLPATLGGAVWQWAGMPLGWLMGSALVTGGFAVAGRNVVPAPVFSRFSLAVVGASVGLAITPEVASEMLAWTPAMVLGAFAGMGCAALAAPALAHFGGVARSTAFFSLLPGGVIEMANVGARYRAEPTTIASLHAVRVGLVVGLLPLALLAVVPHGAIEPSEVVSQNAPLVLATLAIAIFGGRLGARLKLPAAWLLGAVISVGAFASVGELSGNLPEPMLAIAQVFVGISLGARFERRALATIPRALAVGAPVLIVIITIMAAIAAFAGQAMPHDIPTLILCFSIGGMAEMVLTARALDQDIALVAAFQAVRAVTVNALAGPLWSQLSHFSAYSDTTKG